MNMKVNEVYHGFRLIEEKKLEDIDSLGRIFEHEKTGARLFQLENDDDNKVFSISFRTPPTNSTGIPHILEHSVLCGSRKFRTKEPFVDLVKGSLNTFLNAMTFPDKTMYPVASKNEKDFFNLMDVYLDSVFYPRIYELPEIFMQEGWHYELDDKDGEITYKGVVYNEMKGAFSTPEEVLFRKISETLYPDTCYGLESGGDPEVIPELTYDEFLDFHRRYYHPSNSYIYLYGNGNLSEQLKFINDNYLENFEKIEINSIINEQKPFDNIRETTIEYPVSKEDEGGEKTYLSLNFVTGNALDSKTSMALRILEHMLLETPASPLKQALINADIGKDIFGRFSNEILQPMFSIVAKNSTEDKKDKFKEVIYSTLRDLAKNGIDSKLIEASINKNEFQLREANEGGTPKGLIYGIYCMNSWLYDGDPMEYLMYGNTLEEIRRDAKKGYFEHLIENYLINNAHGSLLVVNPAKGMAESRAENTRGKLSDIKKSFSEEEIDNIIKETEKLKSRQEAPDTTEDLSTIPMLDIKDIDKKSKTLPLEKKNVNGTEIFYHDVPTSGITYLSLLFDTRVVDKEDLPYVSLLAYTLAKISTENYKYDELSKEININLGGIRFYTTAYEDKNNPEKYYPKFVVKAKALTSKTPELFTLLSEILVNTKFDDTKRLKEIIQQFRSQIEMSIFDNGHLVALGRLVSYFSPAGKFIEQLSGIEFYKFISELEKNFDSEASNIASTLKRVYGAIFSKNNMMVSLTGQTDEFSLFERNCCKLFNSLSGAGAEIKEYNIELNNKNEGLLTSGDVQYVAKGYNFKKLGHDYTGSIKVLKTVISLDYLWNFIRVKGGAYGGFARVSRSGVLGFVSYRDPNLKESLDVYNNTPKFLENFEVDENEMTRYIIGTVSDLDYPIHPSQVGEVALEEYITGFTHEMAQKERDEVLNTKLEDIREFSSMVSEVMKEDYYCALGNEDKIKKNTEIFNTLLNVIE